MKRERDLLVRADDAAGSIAANRAIADALGAGVVRNVSLIGCARQDCWDDWTRRFFMLPDAVRDRVAVGLHVTLNAEWTTPSVRFRPCLGSEVVPALVEPETGFFTVSPHALQEQGWGPTPVNEAVREVRAQLKRVRDAGFSPVYLDEHMGVGWLPGLRSELVNLAQSEGLIPASTLNLQGISLSPETPFLDTLENALTGINSPALLVLHPAQDGPETALFWNDDLPPGQVAREREQERRAICNPALMAQLGERNVRLLRYSDVSRR